MSFNVQVIPALRHKTKDAVIISVARR